MMLIRLFVCPVAVLHLCPSIVTGENISAGLKRYRTENHEISRIARIQQSTSNDKIVQADINIQKHNSNSGLTLKTRRKKSFLSDSRVLGVGVVFAVYYFGLLSSRRFWWLVGGSSIILVGCFMIAMILHVMLMTGFRGPPNGWVVFFVGDKLPPAVRGLFRSKDKRNDEIVPADKNAQNHNTNSGLTLKARRNTSALSSTRALSVGNKMLSKSVPE